MGDDRQLSAWILIAGSVAVGWWYWRLPQADKLARLGRTPAPGSGGNSSGGTPAAAGSGPGAGFAALVAFANQWGLTITSPRNGDPGNGTGGHNPGSLHYTWQAIDVSAAGLTDAIVSSIKAAGALLGITVIDERGGPAAAGGVWTGPHLHLQTTAYGGSA